MTTIEKHQKIEKPSPHERIERYFEVHPPVPLNFHAKKLMHWGRTDVATLDALWHQYVEKGVTHSHHLADLFNQSMRARDLVREANSVAIFGPGFGDEIDIIQEMRQGEIWAIEPNHNAWPVLGFERDNLQIVSNVSALPILQGPVIFVAVHVLRQPSLADDEAMRAFAAQLLRVAPSGFTLLSTLPNSYQVDSKFAQAPAQFCHGGIDADDLLCAWLRELGADAKITMGRSNCLPRARLAKIEVLS
jgi:hypothetical protein